MPGKEIGIHTNKTAAIIFLAIIVAAGIIFLHPQISGLFSLSSHDPSVQGTQDISGNAIQKTVAQTPERQAAFQASLKFEVINRTELAARLVRGKIHPCPQYSELVFEITNSGKFAAQRLFVEYHSEIKVQDCGSCTQKEILAGQTITLKLDACRAEEKRTKVEFSAVNAEKQAVELR